MYNREREREKESIITILKKKSELRKKIGKKAPKTYIYKFTIHNSM